MAKFPYHQFSSAAEFKNECLKGSAIAPEFWELAINVIGEQEINPLSHEIEALPIHDALGWDYPRFVQEIEKSLIAGAFLQATGEPWQLKLSRARFDKKKAKPVKYETPKGAGSRAYLPSVPESIQRRILNQHALTGVQPVAPAHWWHLVEQCRDLPIVIGEGAKKGLCGLSHGYAVIALTGCHGGYTTTDGKRSLNPDLERFMVPGRRVIIAFDQDAKRKTRHTVGRAVQKLGELLQTRGCEIAVATWDSENGKGIDDLVVGSGAHLLHQAIASAKTVGNQERDGQYEGVQWRIAHKLGHYAPNMVLKSPDMAWSASEILESIPDTGVIAITGPTGTGKTNLVKELLRDTPTVLSLGHRESLQRGMGARLGLTYISDADLAAGRYIDAQGGPTHRLALCFDSLLKIRESEFPAGSFDLFLDEADQGLKHLLLGGTCGKEGKRPALQAKAKWGVQNARRIFIASAGLSEAEIDLPCTLRGETPYVIQNQHQSQGYPCTLYTDNPDGGDRRLARGQVFAQLQQALAEGQRAIVHTDTKASAYLVEALAMECGVLPDQVLRYDGDTSSEPLQREFADNPNQFLTDHPIQLVVASPSLTSGVSITGDFFDVVFGIFEGQTIAPDDAMQMLHRYRPLVPRIVFAAAKGKPGRLSPLNHLDYQTKAVHRAALIQHVLDNDLSSQLDTTSPFAQYVARVETNHHWEMMDFALYLRGHLESNNHLVTYGELPTERDVSGILGQLKELRKIVKDERHYAKAIAAAISEQEAEKLRQKRALTLKERRELDKFDIEQFYEEPATFELVQWDADGKTRRGLQQLLGICLPGVALDRDRRSLDRLTRWQRPIALHDLPERELYRETLERTGILKAVDKVVKGAVWNDSTPWVIALKQRCLQYVSELKLALNLTVTEKQTPCQFFGMILESLSGGTFKTKSCRKGGKGDTRQRDYWLTPESLGKVRFYLSKLASKTLKNSTFPLCPHLLSYSLLEGVDLPTIAGLEIVEPAPAAAPSPPISRGSPPETSDLNPAIA
ncbi:MAG: plasmid replication protein, CyRepA1 family [Cyanophyceae cyanobacterium]